MEVGVQEGRGGNSGSAGQYLMLEVGEKAGGAFNANRRKAHN
jgi:hypothetical protein